LFSQAPQTLLAELREENNGVPEDKRIRTFRNAYAGGNERFWYFPN